MTVSESYRSYKSIPKWMLLTLLGLSFVFFGNSISNGYSLDDELVTSISADALHPNVEKGIAGIPSIFTSHYVQNAEQKYGYRPITTSSFAIEKSIYSPDDFEARAHFSHFINVLLYGLNAILVCVLVFKLLPAERAYLAFAVAFIFLIHPIHSEVVNNIKCRDELLVFFFGLLGMLSFWKYTHQEKGELKWLVGGLVLIVLSVLSKTNGILFIVLIPLVIYYFSSVKNVKLLKLFGGLIVLAAVVVTVSKMMVPDSQIREMLYLENPLYELRGFGHKIPMFFYCIAWYLKMLLFPYPLSYYYGFNQIPLADWSHPMVWIGFVFVVGGTILVLLRMKKKEVWAFGFLFFMIAIGPLANLFGVAPGIVAERFANLPSLGFIIVGVYYGSLAYRKVGVGVYKKVSMGVIGVVLLSVSIYNWNRNEVWESKFSLYSNDIHHLQNSAKAHSLLSQEYKKLADANSGTDLTYRRYIDSAVFEINAGLRVYPEYANLWNNKGYISHIIFKDVDTAIVCYSKAVSAYDSYDEAYFNLATAYMDKLGGLDLVLDGLALVVEDSLGVNDVGKVNYTELEDLGTSEYLINQGIENVIQQSAQQVVESRFHHQLLVKVERIVADVLKTSKSVEISKFPFQEHTFDRLSTALKTITKDNAADVMQQYLTDVKNLFIYYNQSIFQNSYDLDKVEEVTAVFSVLEEEREKWVDLVIENHNRAIKHDGAKLHVYERFAMFLSAEGRVPEFIELNEKGIKNQRLKGKTQLYLNLILIYKHKQQYDLAFKTIDDGLVYLSSELKVDGITNPEKIKMRNVQNSFLKIGVQLAEETGDKEALKKYK